MPLNSFHPIIAEWFRAHVGDPTDVQVASWPVIASGQHTLIAAPTGSGKTLAAFLTCIDVLLKQALTCELSDQTQIVYVSPLKALSHDVQKNLQEPLAQITQCALSAGYLVPPLRVEVRTGDTPAAARQRMLTHPPHILITTPETLFLMLTARKSRGILGNVKTVIVDEIHAVAPNKRGTHLALSLERLAALCPMPPVRIGLSATQRPLELVADFLVGGGAAANGGGQGASLMPPYQIVDVGQKRKLDLEIEVPRDELGPIATNAMWAEIYDRIAELAREHRTTLVFVNTRRLAERVAHHLAERLGEEKVMAHHGSLSRKIRLAAEDRLKTGQLQVMVATASLELGIDIGHVDLACQIGSPRAIATCMQRIGRAGHWVGATPKGRLFCTTRDDLVECAAAVHAIRRGNLDPVTIPPEPVDILAQQIVAEVAAQEWSTKDLYQLCTRAFPYRHLTRDTFDSVLHMVAEGYVPGRRRQQAYVFHDRVQQQVRPRRGARLAAITSGGAIPDTATYAVVAEPEGKVVGSVDEDFAVESLAGDIILLGTSSWRIRGIETGKVRVEDAHGAPPNIPFWRGEAPSRTVELSHEVAQLRERVSHLVEKDAEEEGASARSWLYSECGVDEAGAAQILAYVQGGRRVLGAVPTQQRIIAERFFDEAGGMQLVIHSPFGGRLNRAWGLALRKRFCVNFDFELQAAATDEGLVLSLGEKHSFPLDAIFSFLHSKTVRDVLIQALLASPLFVTRWRWNISRSLALLRFQKGKKVPLHIQRMRAEDLLGAAFPMATACQDNHVGDVPIPDHPLVQETVRDCLTEAMDIDGLIQLLQRMESGDVQCLAVESPAPSPFAHEILNANPYAFLDDAPLEERRARAVNLRQVLPSDMRGELGALDSAAIAAVVEEAWPTVRDADELHETLHLLVWVPEELGAPWKDHLPALLESKRAVVVEVQEAGEKEAVCGWVTTEQLPIVQALFPHAEIIAPEQLELLAIIPDAPSLKIEGAMPLVVQGWMESCGPVTERELSNALHLPQQSVSHALLHLEAQGQVLRGAYRSSSGLSPSPFFHTPSPFQGEGRGEGGGDHLKEGPVSKTENVDVRVKLEEWCDRRLLARIHRRTVSTLRREIEPVTAADFMRFLFRWQHRAPGSQLHGETGLREVIAQLAGFETAASAWEPSLLRERISNYKPELLDMLCLRGTVAWGRFTPPYKEPRVSSGRVEKGKEKFFSVEERSSASRRINPTSLAPISFFLREDAPWHMALSRQKVKGGNVGLRQVLSSVAQDVLDVLESRGASFFADLTESTSHLSSEVEQALWELVAVGMVTADGFDNLRALINPKRRNAEGKERARRPRHSAGRWDLLLKPRHGSSEEKVNTLQLHEKWAKQLLLRYGVVFRDLVKRESLSMTWRELLIQYRRMEWRGEIRGGRFVNGFTGEQYALPEAVESLRAVRRDNQAGPQEIRISAADPLNLVGIILPGERVPANSSKTILFRNGIPSTESSSIVALA